MLPRHARWLRVVLFAGLLSAAFYAGTEFTGRPTPPVQAVTGRPIAGMATDQAWLERPAREAEETPDRALALIGIRPGLVVADVGAGTGYMTIRLARLVGPAGKVYANELQPAMLQTISRKIQAEGLSNVAVVQGSATDAALPEGAIDVALLVDVYHELRYPEEMLRSVRRALKPGGELILVEYRKEDPRIPIAEVHRTSLADLRAEIEPEGFVLDRVNEELPRQHIVVFRRAAPGG